MKRLYPFLLILIFIFSGFHFIHGIRSNQEKRIGGVLRLGVFDQPAPINPITTDSTISANLIDLVFDSLVRIEGYQKIRPGLAETWEISSDGLLWIFHLKRGVRFQDGHELQAEDVQFTFEEIRKRKKGGYQNFSEFIEEITTPDDYTVQIKLKQPDQNLWAALGFLGIAPKHLLQNDPDFSSFNRHPVGSGPYRFVSQAPEEIILEANPDYFEGRPYLQSLHVLRLANQTAVLNHLIAEKIDMAFLPNPKDYGALKRIPNLKLYDNWYPLGYMMTLNLKNPLFQDPGVRKALNLAIRKQRLVNKVLFGRGNIAAGTVTPEEPGFDHELKAYEDNPKLADEILESLGWKRDKQNDYVRVRKGLRFEFAALAMEGEEVYLESLRWIQEDLQEVGIRMKIEVLPIEEYLRRVFHERHFDANIIHFISRPYYDNNFSFWHSSQIERGLNFSSYADPRVDHLMEEHRLSLDSNQKIELLKEFQQTLHDDPPGVFLFWRKMPIALHQKFRDVPEKRMESLRDLVKVWMGRGGS